MKLLPDGVYVGLRAETYFAQDRLGSTDLSVLHNRPADWFYGSRHNPFRAERKATEEMEFGSALHALLLEGEDAYAEAAALSPYDDFKTKVAQTWRDEQRLAGKIIIDEDMDRRVRHMAALIQNHPDLGGPMQAGLSEVSVLWTDDHGIRHRARFDKLLPRFVVDLKTYGGDGRGHSTTQECMALVAQRHMDVQRFAYFLARQRMAGLIEAGAVFGATPAQVDWLRRVAAIEDWRWCWIFYRRRDDAKGHAPIVKPIMRSHFDASFETGRQKVEVALRNYRTFVDRFGFEVPWAVVEPAEEPADHEFPPWLKNVAEPVTFPDPEKDAA